MRGAHVIVVASGVLGVCAVIAIAVRARTPSRHRVAISAQPSEPSQIAATPEPTPSAPPSARSSDGRQPPRLARSSDPDTILVPRDPRSPDYDANKLLHASAGPPTGLFAAEPRDQAWAAEREDVVQTLVLRRLREVDPDAKMDIECHTAICVVHVDSHNKALTDWLGMYPLGCLATSYSVVGAAPDTGGSATTRSDFYLVFDQAGRSRDGLLAARDGCDRHRDEWLAAVRNGKAPWEVMQ
jgi:hypothetical protein